MERNDIMIRLLWAGSVRTRYFLRRNMPTNILLDTIRTRQGLKWGVPAMLLAVPYFLIAAIVVQLIEDGGPGWLNVLILLSLWNGLKMLWIGPSSLLLLARVRTTEFKARREYRRTTMHTRTRQNATVELEAAR